MAGLLHIGTCTQGQTRRYYSRNKQNKHNKQSKDMRHEEVTINALPVPNYIVTVIANEIVHTEIQRGNSVYAGLHICTTPLVI